MLPRMKVAVKKVARGDAAAGVAGSPTGFRDRARDERFMRRALSLAARGLGRTHPNPAVGAVVVKSGTILGEGFHRRAGAPHAEIVALRRAGRAAAGATLYVTLEPCCHFGRTPPCAEAVRGAGIARVVVGLIDPDPRVKGKGARRLRRAGISVSAGVLACECEQLLIGYRTRIATGRPMVVLKLAMSLDGRIATLTRASHWITGPAARGAAHRLRNRLDAVMVGAGTVLADDPRLTCRLPRGRDPVRVIIDGRLGISPKARVLGLHSKAPTWILTASDASPRRASRLASAGAEIIRLRGHGRVSLPSIMRELGRRGLTSVLLEGGSQLAAAALKAGIVDRVVLFIAPILIGGDGVPAVGSLGTKVPSRAVRLIGLASHRVGGDLMIEGTLPSAIRTL